MPEYKLRANSRDTLFDLKKRAGNQIHVIRKKGSCPEEITFTSEYDLETLKSYLKDITKDSTILRTVNYKEFYI